MRRPPFLKSEVLVHTDVVTLGDLIDGLGDKGNVSVFAAPRLGQSGTIQAVRILQAARDNGVSAVETGALTQVSVRRAGRLVSPETVDKVVTEAIIAEHGLPASIEVTLDAGADFYVEPQARTGLRVRSLELDKVTGRFTADIVTYGAAPGQGFRATGVIADEVEVPVLKADLQRNTPIGIDDVVIEKRHAASWPTTPFSIRSSSRK